MALSNLGELRTAALGPRTDLIGQFGTYVALAEQRIYYGEGQIPPLRVLPMEQNAALAFTAGVAAQPPGFLDKRAIYWEGSGQTVSLTYEPPSIFYPANACRLSTSYPSAYTIEGTSIKISPELTGTARLLYYAKLATPSADGDTNAILANWPGIYLFGTQIELYRTTRNEVEMMKAMKMYADAVFAANNQTMAARSFGGPLRRRVGFGV